MLNARSVRYVIIGASAFPAYGYTRFTKDLDILFEPAPENAKRLQDALIEFGYPAWNASIEEFLEKKILFRNILPLLDTHPSAKGTSWNAVWSNRVVMDFDGVLVPCASLDDLIDMKRAAGRAQDLADLVHLEAIKARRDGGAKPG